MKLFHQAKVLGRHTRHLKKKFISVRVWYNSNSIRLSRARGTVSPSVNGFLVLNHF